MIARRLLLVGPALLSVAGGGGPPAPAVVELSIRASTDVNPNPAGTPVSVAARLYSLMGRGRFMSADAYALMDRGLNQQAVIYSYVDDLRYIAVVCLLCIPVVLLLKRVKPKGAAAAAH